MNIRDILQVKEIAYYCYDETCNRLNPMSSHLSFKSCLLLRGVKIYGTIIRYRECLEEWGSNHIQVVFRKTRKWE
jgi:hypothetical protein